PVFSSSPKPKSATSKRARSSGVSTIPACLSICAERATTDSYCCRVIICNLLDFSESFPYVTPPGTAAQKATTLSTQNQTLPAILSPCPLPLLSPPPARHLSRPCRETGGDSSALDNSSAFRGSRRGKLA